MSMENVSGSKPPEIDDATRKALDASKKMGVELMEKIQIVYLQTVPKVNQAFDSGNLKIGKLVHQLKSSKGYTTSGSLREFVITVVGKAITDIAKIKDKEATAIVEDYQKQMKLTDEERKILDSVRQNFLQPKTVKREEEVKEQQETKEEAAQTPENIFAAISKGLSKEKYEIVNSIKDKCELVVATSLAVLIRDLDLTKEQIEQAKKSGDLVTTTPIDCEIEESSGVKLTVKFPNGINFKLDKNVLNFANTPTVKLKSGSGLVRRLVGSGITFQYIRTEGNKVFFGIKFVPEVLASYSSSNYFTMLSTLKTKWIKPEGK